MKENNPHINRDNVRVERQGEVMDEIERAGICPFCPEYLNEYHKEEILRKGAHWLITRNQWPYENTSLHLLAIATYHAETIADLKKGSFDELQDHMAWAEKEFDVTEGVIALRFGASSSATVHHLHAHLIVPSGDLPEGGHIRFKIK